ncbi:hypothetical protein C7M84_016068 [Penaeus vannamei]|uniref:C-type lectin domain-containing protein n=1 Tax=Penaeus vannamei TaxID=6689 RepID=A0A423SP31_PENVA|nr:hypothetical protein C7M84_016068 [Penaeus vannamei]
MNGVHYRAHHTTLGETGVPYIKRKFTVATPADISSTPSDEMKALLFLCVVAAATSQHYGLVDLRYGGSEYHFSWRHDGGRKYQWGPANSYCSSLGNGYPQPTTARDGREFCLAVLNNFYNDGIRWHDVACHHEKPIVCERRVGFYG